MGRANSFILTFLLAASALSAAESSSNVSDLGDFFGLYLLKDDRRAAEDKVVVRGTSAEISYWRSLKSRDPAAEICNAYKWLLIGRGVYGKGAAAAFDKYPQLQEIQIRFYDIETGTKLGTKKAEILPTQRIIPYLKVGVTRAGIARNKPNPDQVKSDVEKGKCASLGQRYIESRWFDQTYLKQAK